MDYVEVKKCTKDDICAGIYNKVKKQNKYFKYNLKLVYRNENCFKSTK